MIDKPIAIRLENVTQKFRVIHERPDTLRELFSRFNKSRNSFHDFEAVSDVSFDVHKGEIVGLIGRNGSGKSTLLKIVAGVYRPTRGKVTVNGSLAPMIELGAGMHHELTGRENILLNGLLMGYSREIMRSREQKIIEFADIGDFIDAPVKQYSSGMYMRLAFAVATEVDPDILVVDEILAVGDFTFQEKCLQRLKAFREAGKTILFVSHTMDQIENYCDRVVLLEKGKMAVNGSPAEAIKAYLGESNVEEPVLVETPSPRA
jgi:ABC-2 type transport system ATP-binding protein/lipopolysaccharide transport system ATP-binding protein